MTSRPVSVRLSEIERARLDRLSRARGLTRSELVRALLAEADGADGAPATAPPSRSEALRLLADKARGGSVVATIALERALRLEGEPALRAPVKTGPISLSEGLL
jgi:Ribbon-helix-helix protein, copG family